MKRMIWSEFKKMIEDTGINDNKALQVSDSGLYSNEYEIYFVVEDEDSPDDHVIS